MIFLGTSFLEERFSYPNLQVTHGKNDAKNEDIKQLGAPTLVTNFRDSDQQAFSEIRPDLPILDQNGKL